MRRLLLLAIAPLLLAGCQPQTLPWSLPSPTTTLPLGSTESEVTLQHDDPAGAPIAWSFASTQLFATPAAGTLAPGASTTIRLSPVAPLSAPIGVALPGRFESGGVRLPVTLTLTCSEPLMARALRNETEWLVGYRSGVDIAAARGDVADLVVAAGGRVLRQGAASEHDLVALPRSAAGSLAALRALPAVAYLEENGEFTTLAAAASPPNDPLYPKQWNLSGFGAEAAWAIAAGVTPERPVVVAVIDDGVSTTHPELRAALLPGFDVVEENAEVRNCIDHGTHVAGIVAAEKGNDTGVAGVAPFPWVKILPVKAWPNTTDTTRTTSFDSVLRAMRWAAGLPVGGLPANPHPADILNLSLGSASANAAARQAFETAIAEIEAAGTTVIAAAGNFGVNRIIYPAAAGAIAVGSVDFDLRRSSFSNYGEQLTLMAPGGAGPTQAACPDQDVLSTGLERRGDRILDSYSCKAGTSMSTPFVAGAVALLVGVQPELRGDPVAVRGALTAAAARHRPAGYTAAEYGAGILCLDALLGADSVCGNP